MPKKSAKKKTAAEQQADRERRYSKPCRRPVSPQTCRKMVFYSDDKSLKAGSLTKDDLMEKRMPNGSIKIVPKAKSEGASERYENGSGLKMYHMYAKIGREMWEQGMVPEEMLGGPHTKSTSRPQEAVEAEAVEAEAVEAEAVLADRERKSSTTIPFLSVSAAPRETKNPGSV